MTKHFRIAIVAACPFPYPRGTPVRIFRMAEELARRGHDVHVITYHLGEDVRVVPFKVYRIPEIKTYHKYSPGPTYQKLLLLDLLLAIKLLQVLQRHQIDVIHAHHYEGLLVATAVQKLTNHPVVYDAHTLLHSELPFYGLGLSKGLKKAIGRGLDRHLPRLADYTISVTDVIREKLIGDTGLDPHKIVTISNGVEYDHFDLALPNHSLRPTDKKTLIFAGNMATYQGIELMLLAFREVLNRRQDVRLQIISNSPFDLYEPLAKWLKIRHHIDIIASDFVNLPRYLARADIALNPRVDCDGIPLKLLNYMAAGKPVVSFAGSAKAIEHNKTGLIVEDSNISDFAQAICQLLADPVLLQRLGLNAKKQVKDKHSWDSMIAKTEEVYNTVCSLRQPSSLRLSAYRQARRLLHWTRGALKSYNMLDPSHRLSRIWTRW